VDNDESVRACLSEVLSEVGVIAVLVNKQGSALPTFAIWLCTPKYPRVGTAALCRLLRVSKPDRFDLAVFEDGDIGHRDANLVSKLGDAHLALGKHDVDIDEIGIVYTVKSFSDLISTAFCKNPFKHGNCCSNHDRTQGYEQHYENPACGIITTMV
jgi:hypothetical protein